MMEDVVTSVATSARIKLKVGSLELEYEGDPSFLTEGIEALLTTMGGLVGKVPNETSSLPEPSAQAVAMNGHSGLGISSAGSQISLSISTIAAHLEPKSGSELAICAMAHLELVQGNTSSSRAEMLAEMKNAKQYYKQSMSNNFSGILASLLSSKRINEGSKGSYALTAAERKKIEAKLAEAG